MRRKHKCNLQHKWKKKHGTNYTTMLSNIQSIYRKLEYKLENSISFEVSAFVIRGILPPRPELCNTASKRIVNYKL